MKRSLGFLALLGGLLMAVPPQPRAAKEAVAMHAIWDVAPTSEVIVGTIQRVADRVTVRVEKVVKGDRLPASITFTPKISLDERVASKAWPFKEGERRLLLFRDAASTNPRLLALANERYISEEISVVQDSLVFHALRNDRDRCQFLVRLVLNERWSRSSALRALEGLNRGEFLPLLAPLAATDEFSRRDYWKLLATNPNPAAIAHLKMALQREPLPLQSYVFSALCQRPERGALLGTILPCLTHPDPDIRREAIFHLGFEGVKFTPWIIPRLWDPDPFVRSSALSWEWEPHLKAHPEVLKRIQELRRDPDSQISERAQQILQAHAFHGRP